jgi:hypothetical protein
MRWILAAIAVAACDASHPPDLPGLTDQVAVVGQPFVLELDGVDPDGDELTYGVKSDISLEGNATLSLTPSGSGLFRWTPVASDVGMHAFDFSSTDGIHVTTVTITIDVRATAAGLPVFQQPLGTGRVVNLTADPCITLEILVEDQDTAELTIAQDEPLIAGAMFDQLTGTTARWHWCPTPAQVAETDRYTVVLSADDRDNPKTVKNYVIVLGGSVGPRLLINEVEYDNVGTDNAEYLELFNPSGSATSLAGFAVVLVNGATNLPYQTIDLSPVGTLGARSYLVIAGPNVTVAAPAVKLNPLWTQDQIQNGDSDGIALIDDVTHTLIDALSYEGSITAVTIPGFAAPVSLVEGTALDAAVADSNTVTLTLCRKPDGSDTNNASVDWTSCTTPTIGKAN